METNLYFNLGLSISLRLRFYRNFVLQPPLLLIPICDLIKYYTWSDNKVRELATVCLPWQYWTKALVRFDDVEISAFHSCVVVVVVVDLWHSLSEWHLLLSACVLVCRREKVGA